MEKEKDLLNKDNSENEFSNNLNLEIIELEDKVLMAIRHLLIAIYYSWDF